MSEDHMVHIDMLWKPRSLIRSFFARAGKQNRFIDVILTDYLRRV